MNSSDIAGLLVESGCLSLSPKNPFTYASGLKGPIYCDNRQLLSLPNFRELIIEALLSRIKEHELEFTSYAGLATAGIAHAAFLADRTKRPMIYIRGKAKGHGQQNQIEGRFEKGEKTLLIEDLVNQGSSLKEAVIAARESGLDVVGCLSIVHYEMPRAEEVLTELNIPLYSLTTFSEILNNALRSGSLKEADIKLLQEWKKNPQKWSDLN